MHHFRLHSGFLHFSSCWVVCDSGGECYNRYSQFAFVRLDHCVVVCVKKLCGSYVLCQWFRGWVRNTFHEHCNGPQSIRVFAVSSFFHRYKQHLFQAIQSHPLHGGEFSDKWAYFSSFCRTLSKPSKGTVTRNRLCNSFPTFVFISAIKVHASWITCSPPCRHVVRDGQPCFLASAHCKPVPYMKCIHIVKHKIWTHTSVPPSATVLTPHLNSTLVARNDTTKNMRRFYHGS
jgi:hypothetical protein